MRSRHVSSASKLPDTPGSRLRRVGPSGLVLMPKPRNRPPMVLWANHQTPRARPGLLPSLLTRPPPCTGSIVHDFVLLASPPCGPQLVPLSTGSLEPSLLVSPSPGGPSRLKTFCARSSPATTRTRPQPTPTHWPRVCPTPVVNHSSLRSGHPSTTGTLLVLRLAIPRRVLCFEDSRLRRRTLVRPVVLIGQTGTHRSDRFGAAAALSSVLRSWLCGSTKEPSGFLVNHWKPRELGVASANLHS
jgi:hypothetical protein